jgi:hypothetical protein
MDNRKMKRVSKRMSCPVCGKPDWCLVAPDGSAAICARIDQGSVKCCGEAGWLHIFRDDLLKCSNRKVYSKRISIKSPDDNKCFGRLAAKFQCQITPELLGKLSDSLGISTASLKRLRTGWDGVAYTFPMSNDFGNLIGIRRRFPDGQKASIVSSKTGLFIPTDLADGIMLICEGTTDTAAALDLGFAAIGRPNCNSCVDMTVEFCKGCSEIVIIGDNDPPKEDGRRPGKEGAEKLAGKLLLHGSSVKVIYPPNENKDLRQWLRAGLTREQLQQIIEKEKELHIKISIKD